MPIDDALRSARECMIWPFWRWYRNLETDLHPLRYLFWETTLRFGHGLSYSTFEYSNLHLPCQTVTKDAIVDVSVDIKNESARDGDEVAMLFVRPPEKPVGITGDRPWKELKSFARVSVLAGQSVTAHLPLRIRDLRRWAGEENGKWVIDSGDYTILVGKNADDAAETTLEGTLHVDGD